MLGFWVLLADKKSKKNQSFFATALAIFLWIVFGYIGLNYYNISPIFLRLNFAAVSLFFVATYFFSIHFPTDTKSNKIVNYSIVFIGSLFAIISLFTNLVIKDTSLIDGNINYEMGDFKYIFYAFVLFLTIFIINNLLVGYFSGNKQQKNNVKTFLIGVIIFATANIIFNVILPNFIQNNNIYARLGDYSAIIFLGFAAYATIKHQLFNLKVIATEVIVLLLSVALFIEIFISNTIIEGLIKFVIWALATYGGYQLIKSVKVEIKQKDDLAKLAKQLEDANIHLKDLDKLKDDFLSMAAHELNTPLAAIVGYLSMILEEHIGGEVNPKIKQYLESMFVCSKRLSYMIHDMLNVSRIESGRIHLIYVDTPVENVIEETISEIDSKAKERKQSLIFHKPSSKIARTWYDAARVTEVLTNIIGNAIKYTDRGGKIEVFAKNDDKFITIWVKDNGRGIAEDRKKVIFEKFSQTEILKDEVKGTGLGMYIAKKFTELQKGKIWFDSTVGKGSTFYFTLPILDKKPYDPKEGEGEVIH